MLAHVFKQRNLPSIFRKLTKKVELKKLLVSKLIEIYPSSALVSMALYQLPSHL